MKSFIATLTALALAVVIGCSGGTTEPAPENPISDAEADAAAAAVDPSVDAPADADAPADPAPAKE